MKKLLILVGTRPNFIKVTQFKSEAAKMQNVEVKIVHTGQHFDNNMAGVFFDQFNLKPDYFLNIGQQSSTQQIAVIMQKLEQLILEEYLPDLLIVPGDVNSTLAGALVANKMGIKLAHLESGLRSFDRQMPEEINRIITDEVSDFYFVTEQSGLDNLKNENKSGKSFFVGNTMIDTMVAFEQQISSSSILSELNLVEKEYVLATIHRPSNVDSKEGIEKLLNLFEELGKQYKIVFPVHPRTSNRMEEYQLMESFKSISTLIFVDPLGYFDFQKLIKSSSLVLTDSGGIQEESTFRQVPCITLRNNTERPITVTLGTNCLMPFDVKQIISKINFFKNNNSLKGEIPPLWDGKSTQRILEIISKEF